MERWSFNFPEKGGGGEGEEEGGGAREQFPDLKEE